MTSALPYLNGYACATWQGGFVSPMRVGLSARVVIHDA